MLVSIVFANSNFVIQSISIQGLQGISQATVLNYVTVKPGETFSLQKSNQLIQSLYKTGFFNNVDLSRQGNTLVINVDQRPIIGKITISGNDVIKTDQLKKVLKQLGFVEGQVYNPSVLSTIKKSLAEEYFVLGKYNARIDVDVKKQVRNRVSIAIKISEGVVSKIKQIRIIGNKVFDESVLLKQLTLSTSGLFTWYTHNDRYTKEKLGKDLEALRSYYLDRGYLKFKIDSSQVSLSPDRQSVYIVVHITEGPQYTMSDYSVSGRLILPRHQILSMIDVNKGEIFSKKAVMAINKKIIAALGAKGYSNAEVNVLPKFNEKLKTVSLNFHVVPGPRIYIHRISFSDNYRTNDETLRRELKVLTEGGPFETDKVKQTKRALLQLPYLSNVDVTTTPVPRKPNEVDVNYKVTEVPSAQLQGGIGYSTLEKLMFNAGITQKNLLGTGNTLGLNFTYSAITTNLNLDYFNPYYTKSGIGRDINAYISQYDASSANVNDYVSNDYGVAMNFTMPFDQYNTFNFGGGYENNYINVSSTPSTQQAAFIREHGRHFYQFDANLGWSYSSLDRILFPRSGIKQSINLKSTIPFAKQSLRYYKTGYSFGYYQPLIKSFIGHMTANINYGKGYGSYIGLLPFFKNYYAGGFGSVRGFEANSIGPKDSKGDTMGGNFEMDASASLILPNFISDAVRTSLFVDAGDVYQTSSRKHYHGVKLNEMRTSVGIELDWRSPIAMLNFSLATPLHKRRNDDANAFDFNIGSSFG